MNQTRVFLIFAWLMVATLLWFEWSRDKAAPAQPAVAAQTATAPAGSTVPTATDAAPATGTVPAAPVATPGITQAPRAAAAPRVTVNTDVLRLVLDGGSVLQADLLHYPQSKTPGSGPVRLFSEDPQHFSTAESGWVSNGSKAPDHHAFVPENGAGEVALAKGSDSISVPFVWQGPEGVTIRRTYTFKRASYEIEVLDQVVNAGTGTWQGMVYRQLLRTPPQVKSGMTNPESFSFNGATWWDGSYQRRKFNEDYLEDGRVNAQVKGGWIAIPQHHFFSAWIPSADDTTTISLDTPDNGARALIRGAWIAGAVLLGIVVLKLLLVDMRFLGTLSGIVSFLAVGALLVLCMVYRVLLVRSVHLYADSKGVWLYRGILPWNRGAVGVKWRDMEDAAFTSGFSSWLFNSYTVRVGNRFSQQSEILVHNIANGREAVNQLNELQGRFCGRAARHDD